MALWELFTKFFPKINFQQSQPDFIFTPSLRLYIAMTHTSTTLESYSTTFYFLEEKNVTLAFHFSAIEICFHFVLYLYYYFQCWLMFSQFVLMYKMYNGLNLTIKCQITLKDSISESGWTCMFRCVWIKLTVKFYRMKTMSHGIIPSIHHTISCKWKSININRFPLSLHQHKFKENQIPFIL